VYQQKGWLADSVETIRNGRRVLSVAAEHKRQIRGIIHDESATGKTAFIEPEEVIQINNDIFDLQSGYRKEIYKLFRELCNMLRPYVSLLDNYIKQLAQLDLIFSKAAAAISYGGHMPEISEHCNLNLKKAQHPLLFIKNMSVEKPTQHFDLELHAPNRILLLSGPNAGGKSILMKAVGLIQLMFQSGMLVPASEQSVMSVFEKIGVELGDQQSIEDDLSTYSSRLKHMQRFLQETDEKSLVLIDEFGSGTDPKLGGAIAEGLLHALNRKKAYAVITTHYSNLKLYAYKTKGIVNGAMIFDQEKILPTYKLRIGRPGSSFAFEIAEKTGLDSRILNYAKKKAGKDLYALEHLLIQLQSDKELLDSKIAGVDLKERKLDQLVRNYEKMLHELEIRKKKFKLEQKEKDFQKLSSLNQELERIIRDIRENQNIEEAKKKLGEIKKIRQKDEESIKVLNEEIFYNPKINKELQSIEVGSFVQLRRGSSTGKIESIEKKQAFVVFSGMRMKVPMKELVAVNEPLDIRKGRSIQSDFVKHSGAFNAKLDIRGMRLEDAFPLVERFLDDALLSNAMSVKIIHGKGSGALKQLVQDKLKDYPIKGKKHPAPEQGGDGVTLVDF
jgi:DNA mismatch repair protein MutS2